MKPIYFDNQATTQVDPKVFEVMKRYYLEDFGNPHSTENEYGRKAATVIKTSKSQIATSINASPEEIFFTSGATESNNLAILGLAAEGQKTNRKHIITTAIEHKAVLKGQIM